MRHRETASRRTGRKPARDPTAPVLVVDDDEGVRTLVARALRRAGFEVFEAANGRDGLDIVEREAIGIVVLDMGMPEMSGTDVVHALRERPQTATLPVILMTGSGDEYSLVTGLGAGADDFLAKPVRMDELVARVRAHLRARDVWSNVVEQELRKRSAVVESLGHLTLSTEPDKAAEQVVEELARRTDCDFIAVMQLVRGDRMLELATYSRTAGLKRSGALLGSNLSRELVARARQGPWVEDIVPLDHDVRTDAFASAELEIGAGGPIYAGDQLVGLLSLGVGRETGPRPAARKAGLLASAIDFASMLSAVAGPAFADRRGIAELQANLRHILAAQEFRPVFQPIVELRSRTIVGYEALTRFDDGERPDVRFAKAASVGLGHQFELATIEAALARASGLPEGTFLSLNISPGVVLDRGRRLRTLIRSTSRPLVFELTEHLAIDDYPTLRTAIAALGEVRIAVDDAGAGYASLRHILELRPAFAKLDISLVRGIDGDEPRQAMAAGLDYFAMRSGCHLIAEGVESEGEAAALGRLNVEFAQGYLFGRPEPVPA
jgi:EAL domain-containing protein (putative c-di-GMP-specific phosphodiesterase class I)/DNA-binding response OmpR family regulator